MGWLGVLVSVKSGVSMAIRNTTDASSAAHRVKSVRRRAGITQSELAQRMLVSRSLVAQWETARARPDSEQMKLITQICSSGPRGEAAVTTPRSSQRGRVSQNQSATGAKPRAAGKKFVEEMRSAASAKDVRAMRAMLRDLATLAAKVGMVETADLLKGIDRQMEVKPASKQGAGSATKEGKARVASTVAVRPAKRTKAKIPAKRRKR